MIDIARSDQRRAFAMWLRTGRASPSGPIELKFNPWHDPEDGRFTFAGTGQYSGGGSGASMPGTPGKARRSLGGGTAPTSGRATRSRSGTAPAPVPAKPSSGAVIQLLEQKPKAPSSAPPGKRANAASEFIAGAGEGLYDTAAGTANAVYSALTTNPATTMGNAGQGIAQTIDAAIAAEDVPARVQVSRTAAAVRNASPRDIGRAAGIVAGNAALTAAPGLAVGKIAALRRLRNAGPPAAPYVPPDIRWVRENLGEDSAFKRYNDAAFGARPGQAPAIRRTMPNGSKRPVKFDGLQGDTLIDRKLGVDGRKHAVDQMLRQSQALSENNLRAVWEVPTLKDKTKALKMLKRHNIRNIGVRIVKP